jgi:hypothetical protein
VVSTQSTTRYVNGVFFFFFFFYENEQHIFVLKALIEYHTEAKDDRVQSGYKE